MIEGVYEIDGSLNTRFGLAMKGATPSCGMLDVVFALRRFGLDRALRLLVRPVFVGMFWRTAIVDLRRSWADSGCPVPFWLVKFYSSLIVVSYLDVEEKSGEGFYRLVPDVFGPLGVCRGGASGPPVLCFPNGLLNSASVVAFFYCFKIVGFAHGCNYGWFKSNKIEKLERACCSSFINLWLIAKLPRVSQTNRSRLGVVKNRILIVQCTEHVPAEFQAAIIGFRFSRVASFDSVISFVRKRFDASIVPLIFPSNSGLRLLDGCQQMPVRSFSSMELTESDVVVFAGLTTTAIFHALFSPATVIVCISSDKLIHALDQKFLFWIRERVTFVVLNRYGDPKSLEF